MKNRFYCPHCQSVLNPNVKIILAASFNGMRGLILLSPQPGNYKFIADSTFAAALRPGAEVTYSCPVCSADLTSETHDKLVELTMRSADNRARRVAFARSHGVRATFIIDDGTVTPYGEDAEEFETVNFFGV
jgi:hypothetical protein